MPAPIVTAHQLARLLLAGPDGQLLVDADVNHTEGTAFITLGVEGGGEGWVIHDNSIDPAEEEAEYNAALETELAAQYPKECKVCGWTNRQPNITKDRHEVCGDCGETFSVLPTLS